MNNTPVSKTEGSAHLKQVKFGIRRYSAVPSTSEQNKLSVNDRKSSAQLNNQEDQIDIDAETIQGPLTYNQLKDIPLKLDKSISNITDYKSERIPKN